MSKFRLFSLLFVLTTGLSVYGQSTSDYFRISSNELIPDGKTQTVVTVELVDGNSEKTYCAFQMDIIFPDGVVPVYDSKEEDYIIQSDADLYKRTHIASSKFITLDDGRKSLRVQCSSSKNADFYENEGELFTFKVVASGFTKPTNATFKIEGSKLISAQEIGYVPNVDMKGCSVSNESSVPFNVSSSAHWSTCVLPFDAELPDGITALTSDNYDEENIYLTKAESIKAYTPYVLYSEEGYSGTVSGTVDPEKYPEDGYVQNGLLCGAIVPQKVTEGFVLQNLQDGVKFYGIGSGSTFNIPAGKCWMSLSASNAKALNFVISDVTGITALNTTTANDGVIYNLQGMKVTTPVAGNIYIRNGKKFAINK